MKIYNLLLISVCFLAGLTSVAQQRPGKCSSYTTTGNQVTFNCEHNFKVRLELCSGEVLKLWYAPTGTFNRSNESFAVINEKLGSIDNISVEEQAQSYEIFTSQLRIRINKSPFGLQIFDKYQKLLLGDYKEDGFVQEGVRKTTYKALRSDEQFFGLGEKAGPINRRGRSYKMWNSDQPCYGVDQDPLYKSIPFFLSSYRYGIFLDNTYKTEFKFGSESKDYFSFETPGGEFIYYFIYGNDYKEIIQRYTQLTGKPIMPPKWAFGFSQCRGMLTREDLSREIAEGFRSRNIPCDIIYQDIGWVEGLQDFDWKKNNYTNPKQMVSDLGKMGYKMILSQDPVISQANKKQWKEADSLGYFTTDTRTGKSYDMPWPWGGNCGVVDFTKPAVADWWGNYQQKPINDGVRGFWTDMGEPAWSNEDATERLFMKHHLGMHDEIHNVYGFTWDKVVKEQFDKHNPNKRIFQMTRSAYAGLQRYTFGWSGDAGNGNNVLDGWNQLANQVAISMSAGMGLIPFWSCDISGYCGDIKDYQAMAELYARWIQFGVFNPLSRAHHEGNNAAEPWLFGPEVEVISRKAIEMKYQLFPYIYSYAREAHDQGFPIMRALMLEYPNDRETYRMDGQFLFGKELLVAPVVEKGAITKEVYLPEGEWINYHDGKTAYRGGQWITVDAPLNVIPVFVKKGSVIPSMPVMQYIHERSSYPVYWDIFPGAVNKESSFTMYEDDGESRDYEKGIYATTRVSSLTNKDGFTIKVGARDEKGYKPEGQRNFVLKIHSVTKPGSVTINKTKIRFVNTAVMQKAIESDLSQLSWNWDEKSGIIYVKLPDTGLTTEINIHF